MAKDGFYREFFKECVELARKRGYTELQVDVAYGNNLRERLYWSAPIEEKFDITEVRKA